MPTDLLFAVFNSAHRVMKAEYVLKKAGITILLIPAPRAFSTDCGLAIRFDDTFYDAVTQILTAETVPPDTIYRKVSDAHYEVIWNRSNGTTQSAADGAEKLICRD
ncbi:MAG: DUF3343 domain-containing protein [Desulfuromonadaceae bacterium]|nr:DUF3343 domain-containing protein [Desulfuromonadaceae bacterium]MDD5106791.1 DUF3343 domain-containing protein [Desulfuromonadaceae bacterium]